MSAGLGTDRVLALAAAAQSVDHVAPLSEAFLLALTSPDVAHLGEDRDGTLVGYAQVDPTGATELVGHPDHRRTGLGTSLWQAAAERGATTAWAHGDLPAARALAKRVGLDRVRELHRMERPLTAADHADAVLPQGFSSRTFTPKKWTFSPNSSLSLRRCGASMRHGAQAAYQKFMTTGAPWNWASSTLVP